MPKRKLPKPIVSEPFRATASRPHPDGTWYWRARRMVGGVQVQAWSGRATREAVVAIVAGLPREAGLDKGVRLSEVLTMDDLLLAWLAACERGTWGRKPLRPATLATYRMHAKRVAGHLGEVRVEDFNERHVALYLQRSRRDARATGSLRLDVAVLSMACAHGRTIGAPVARDIVWPTLDKRDRLRERITPTADEVLAVIDHLTGWRADAVRIMWSTGARIGEVASLRVQDIDFTHGWVWLGGKTGRRQFPISPDLVPTLRRLADGKGPDQRVMPVSYEGVRRISNEFLRPACIAAGSRVWTSHGLRRAVVNQLARSGVDVASAAKLMGHSVQIMLEVYRQVTEEDLVAAVAKARIGVLEPGKVLPFRHTTSGTTKE